MSTAIRQHQTRVGKARVTQPKPGKTRPSRRVRERTPGRYDPRIASRGLTLDTDLGPVDTVALDPAEDGRGPVFLTEAERDVLFTRLALREPATRWSGDPSLLDRVAEAIGASPERLAKRVYARRAALRALGLYPAKAEGAGHG